LPGLDNNANNVSLGNWNGNVTIFAGGGSSNIVPGIPWDFDNTGNLTAPGNISTTANVAAGNVLTDHLLYANGTPWDLQEPAGSNTEIQFNNNSQFGATANFTFDTAANLFAVNATANIANVNVTGNVVSGNVLFGSGIVSGTGNIYGGNIISGNAVIGNIQVSGDVTVNSLTSNTYISATGNVISGNVQTSGLISATGNITSGNLTIANTAIVATSANSTITLQPAGTGLISIDTTTGLVIPVGNTAQRPSPGTTGTIRFNTESSRVEVYDGTEWDTVVGGVTNQILNGDGSTVAFTLDRSTTTAAALIVLNGITQVPGQAYSMVPSPSTNLVFSEAPGTGDVIDIRFL